MSFGERFIKTLKLIKYPEVDKLKPASFDWMIENKDAKDFLESFCTNVSEENVISDEELQEYDAMLADKTIDLNVLEKLADLEETGLSEEDVQEQVEAMKVDTAYTEKYIRELEHQKDLINMHKLELVQEAEISEVLSKEHQKEVQKIKDEIFPNAVSELKFSVESGLQAIKDLRDILADPPEVKKNLSGCALFLHDLKPHFDSEEELLQSIKLYLDNDVPKLMDSCTSQKILASLEGFILNATLEESEKGKVMEAVRLKKVLVDEEDAYVESVMQQMKTECQIRFLKDLEENGGLSSYDIPENQLRARFEKAQKMMNELQEEHVRLREDLSRAIREKVQSEVDQVIYMCCKEKSAHYEAYLKLLQKPLDALIQQRTRLEFINVVLSVEKKKIGKTLEKVICFRKELQVLAADSEQLHKYLEDQKKSKEDEAEYIEEGSLLHTVNKILSTESDPDLLYFTANDVYFKIKRSNEEKQKLAEEAEKLLKEVVEWISTAEKNKDILDNYFYGKKSKDPNHPSNILEGLNSKLNRLSIKIQDLEEKLLKEMQHYQKKKKLIQTNSNLSKARKLFVYAVNNKEKYMECIQEIKAQEKCLSSYHSEDV